MPVDANPPGGGSWTRAQAEGSEWVDRGRWEVGDGRVTMGRSRWLWIPALIVFVVVTGLGLMVAYIGWSVGRSEGLDERLALAGVVVIGLVAVFLGVVVARLALGPATHTAWQGGLTVWQPQWVREPTQEAARLRQGAMGEEIIAEILQPLRTQGYVVFHDLVVPGGTENIDHVVIGPTGFYVIDTQNLAEDVHVAGGEIWQGDLPFAGSVEALRRHCAELKRLVADEASVPVQGLFSLVGHQRTPTFVYDDVLVVRGPDLLRVIHARQIRPPVTPDLVAWLAQRLRRAFDPASAEPEAGDPPYRWRPAPPNR
jgi:hypothetical protein